MKHRSWFFAVLSASLFLSLASCSVGPKPIALDFRITWTDYSGRGMAIAAIVDTFNKSHPNIVVTMVSGNEDLNEIQQSIQSEQNKTIYALPYRYVKYFGQQGALKPLNRTNYQNAGSVESILWSFGQNNDTLYGIPWVTHSTALLYNKTLLDEAGVDPLSLTDLSALTAAMEKVEAKTTAKGIGLVGADHNDISWMVNQFIYAFGGSLVDETANKVTVDSPQSAAAIAFYRDVLGSFAQAGWTEDTGVEVMAAFLKQEVAFEIQGVWGLSDIEKNGSPFEVGVIPLSSLGLYPEMGPIFLSIPSSFDEKQQKAAQIFIDAMISKEAQIQIMKGEYSPEHEAYYPFRLSVRNDLKDTVIAQDYPQYLPFMDGLDKASIDVPVALWQTVKSDIYAPGLHQVMIGTLSIDDFLAQVKAQGDLILKGD